jgi:hypothetical protein
MAESPAIAPGHPATGPRSRPEIEALLSDLDLALQSGLSIRAWAKAREIPEKTAYRYAKTIYLRHAKDWENGRRINIGRFIFFQERVIMHAARKADKSPAWATVMMRANEGMIEKLQSLGVLPKAVEKLDVYTKVNARRELVEAMKFVVEQKKKEKEGDFNEEEPPKGGESA